MKAVGFAAPLVIIALAASAQDKPESLLLDGPRATKFDQPHCPPMTPNAPAIYPPVLERSDTEGAVSLRVEVDRCGFVKHAEVGRTSRFKLFDSAAVAAATNWRVDSLEGARALPNGLYQGVVEFIFRLVGQSEEWSKDPSSRREWCETRGVIPEGEGGRVPYAVEDPLPFEGTVALWEARLKATGRYFAMYDRDEYHLDSLFSQEIYELYLPPSSFAPTIIRNRRIHDGANAIWVSALICEADAATCARARERIRNDKRTQALQTWPARVTASAAAARASMRCD
jgi:TonB family protein